MLLCLPAKGRIVPHRKVYETGRSRGQPLRLLAEQDERVLDFAAAEANLQRFVERSSDKPAAYGVLAEFYERRLRFGDAVAALVRQAEAADRFQVSGVGFQGTGGWLQVSGVGGQVSSEAPLPGRVRYRALQRAIGLIESRRLSAPDALTLRTRGEGNTEVLGGLSQMALEVKGPLLVIGNSTTFVRSLLNSAAEHPGFQPSRALLCSSRSKAVEAALQCPVPVAGLPGGAAQSGRTSAVFLSKPGRPAGSASTSRNGRGTTLDCESHAV